MKQIWNPDNLCLKNNFKNPTRSPLSKEGRMRHAVCFRKMKELAFQFFYPSRDYNRSQRVTADVSVCVCLFEID